MISSLPNPDCPLVLKNIHIAYNVKELIDIKITKFI